MENALYRGDRRNENTYYTNPFPGEKGRAEKMPLPLILSP
jgi:hypothetical protein